MFLKKMMLMMQSAKSKTSKNSRMADDDQEKSEVAPNLSDLRSMLVELQCSVNNILRDNEEKERNVGAEIISGYSRPRISKDERISLAT